MSPAEGLQRPPSERDEPPRGIDPALCSGFSDDDREFPLSTFIYRHTHENAARLDRGARRPPYRSEIVFTDGDSRERRSQSCCGPGTDVEVLSRGAGSGWRPAGGQETNLDRGEQVRHGSEQPYRGLPALAGKRDRGSSRVAAVGAERQFRRPSTPYSFPLSTSFACFVPWTSDAASNF